MPKITVIMPCYNASDHLLPSVESVLSQSFSEFEIILIDDASTDDTARLIRLLVNKYSFINAIYKKKNSGPGEARNQGIKKARSDLIALIDADDLWHKDKLKIQYQHHITSQCEFSCTGFTFGSTQILNGKTDYKSLLKNNSINTSSVMFNKKYIDIVFTSNLKSEDYITWLYVAKKTAIYFINKPLTVRVRFSGISANKVIMAKQRWHIYRYVEKIGLLKSFYYMCHYTCSGLIKYASGL